MWRDSSRLVKEKFDILVIGGGIHGATITREFAEAGYSVALVEKNDFCSGASANSLKVIHGGIRYLQHLNIKRMRESIRSRNRLLREFPHLVRRLPCLTPTYGHGMKGREVMAVALKINDLIGWDRNEGVEEAACIPSGFTLNQKDSLKIMPGIREEGLTGAALWYDVLAENTERLVLEFLHLAVEHGAVVANYMGVDGFDLEEDRIAGVHLTDMITQEKITIQPRYIINASGAGVNKLAAMGGQKPVALGWAKAVNLIVGKQLFGKYAVGLEGVRDFYDKDALIQKGKRLFFFVPWRGKTMIGTTYAYHKQDLNKVGVTSEDLDSFLTEVNGVYPDAKLTPADVDYVHCGLVPVMDQEPPILGDVQLDKTTTVVDHGALQGPINFFTVKGVKYTTAVEVASQVMQAVSPKLGRPQKTRTETVEDSEMLSWSESGTDSKIIAHLKAKYGPCCKRIVMYMGAEGDEIICRDPLCVSSEILHGIREEAALHLEDIVFRRTDLASAGCPDRAVLERVAVIMGNELGWSEVRREEEIRSVFVSFTILG
ncbi:MAG: glycerol-3-phosphate dehydrogenase/oxidase [Desulfobulbaceae bacterium]|nr:glycerol-3-phosphate dehydrogenase/oxidase [Desulfobulbaceae bacterium]